MVLGSYSAGALFTGKNVAQPLATAVSEMENTWKRHASVR